MKSLYQINQLSLVSVAITLSVFAVGCGADSLQDTTNQERDRQRQMAAVLSKDYNSVVGSYSSNDSSAYYIISQIKLVNTQKDGSLVPQPSLSGTFRMFSTAKMNSAIRSNSITNITNTCDSASDSDPQKCGYLFAFSGGTYDSLSKVMALHIQGYGVAGADVQCTCTTETLMNCWWQPASGGSDGFNFTISKSP